MKYLIMVYGSQRDYDSMNGRSVDGSPVWTQTEVAALHEFMGTFTKELEASGELVDGQGLTDPVHARRIQLRDGAPVVTDGPYPETEEVLAGFWMVDCVSFDRATELAAKVARCPSPSWMRAEHIDVRPVYDGAPVD
ncbi:YciI family protein [Pseudonocardia spinosispora]|uniref:YciI family protein n=1 Tax=Pseudonocardia spinosispora TaxID=103441 RepID=UPI0004140C18|nr:YciI family protein [Pseudonocardia spinosispora]